MKKLFALIIGFSAGIVLSASTSNAQDTHHDKKMSHDTSKVHSDKKHHTSNDKHHSETHSKDMKLVKDSAVKKNNVK